MVLLGSNTTLGQTSADPPTKPWRPWTICAPAFAAFAVLCLSLCLAVELIFRSCYADGCHIFGAPSTIQVSSTANFIYNFLPTTLSVFFNLLWAVIHHDVLRLEPYIQMSKLGDAPDGSLNGAMAQDSILMDYVYTFPLFTPFIAGKRKHYVVCLSSCILLLVSLVITPLASGLFDDDILTKEIINTGVRSVVKPGDAKFSPAFAYVAYNYHWTGGQMPQFTTPTYAVLPVEPFSFVTGDKETWVAETTMYEAELVCHAGVTTTLVHSTIGEVGFKITDPLDQSFRHYEWDRSRIGQNSIRDKYPNYNPKDTGGYAKYFSPWTSKMIPLYGDSDLHMFLWASAKADNKSFTEDETRLPLNITAIFCKDFYYSQPVLATFAMPSGNITGFSSIGNRTAFTEAAGFMTLFNGSSVGLSELSVDGDKYYDGLGSRPLRLPNVDSQLMRKFGIRSKDLNNELWTSHSPSRSNIFMDEGVNSLPAFSLHDQTSETLCDLLDPKVLAESYQRELKLLFALAVTTELVDKGTAPADTVTVTREVYTRGFTVNGQWARSVQGGLAIVSIMTGIMGFLSCRRRCQLDGEPNSLVAALQLLAASPEICVEVENAEFHTQKELHEVLVQDGWRYQLVLEPGHGPRISVVGVRNYRVGLSPPDASNPAHCTEMKLWAMRTWSGVGLLVFFGLLTTVLVLILVYGRVHNGLPALGGANSFRYKVLFSYFPFVITMVLEPILTSLGSCYCMLGPYKAIGRYPGAKSLTIDYDKSPPHFQLLRSLSARDITLSALIVGIILSNGLIITLGALFSLTSVEIKVPVVLETFRLPVLKGPGKFTNPAEEAYYSLTTNISDNRDAPSWTTPEYFVLPFSSVGHGAIQGPTVGIGVDIKCTLLPATSMTKLCFSNKLVETCVSVNDTWRVHGLDTGDPCLADMKFYGGNDRAFDLGNQKILRSKICSNTFFVGWVEGAGAPYNSLYITEPYNAHPRSVILRCNSTAMIHEITASINQQGQVLSATNVRTFSTPEIESFYAGGSSLGTFTDSFIEGMANAEGGALYTKSSLEWLSYLMVLLTPSIMENVTLPAGSSIKPINTKNITGGWRLPDAEHVVTAFEDLCRRLFAINLRLYYEDVISPGTPTTAPGIATEQTERVKVNGAMMTVALSILLYIMVMLVMLYWWERPHFLHHAPTSLAGVYAFLYASNAKIKAPGITPKKRAENLEGKYSFGYFDGKRHFGVHRDDIPFVKP